MTEQKQASLIEQLQAEHRIVRVEYTEQKVIRLVANKDIPEYGILEGSVFYLVKSESLGDNWYYIATWDYEHMQWDCRCMATKPCKHNKAISMNCGKGHALQGFKPLSKIEKFQALFKKYDCRKSKSKEGFRTRRPDVVIEAHPIISVSFSGYTRHGYIHGMTNEQFAELAQIA